MGLIDGNILLNAITEEMIEVKLIHGLGCQPVIAVRDLQELIKRMPTVDAVPVVHGRWLEDEKAYPGPDLSNYVCSSCKRVGGTWIKGLKPENLFTYCPWCGAKMSAKEDGEC